MLPRVLEPELMDSPEEAREYDAMDHAEVNRQLVTDLLAAAGGEGPGAAAGDGETPAGQPPEVLDLGCGTALVPIELCRRCPRVRVLAVDAAGSMLHLAGVNVALAELEERIRLDCQDCKALDLPADRFAVVISNSLVHHVAQPQAVLQEAVRVAAPGGLLFFRDLLRPGDEAEHEGLVAQYADDASPHQRQMFADSLRAALTLAEVQVIVADLGFAAESVTATSDRHWTWSARKRA